MIKQLVNFSEEITVDQKLEILFKYHNFDRYVKIDEDDKEMIVLALNNTEVTEVKRDDEGGLVIGYADDKWGTNE
jgi:hypothetical protein